jgi:hypothetical protein
MVLQMDSEHLRAAARRLRVRETVERTADSARLFIDSLSDPIYQPVAELGRRYAAADRKVGTTSRWLAMRPVLEATMPRTAVDIGCNAGWFTLELGRLGIPTLGVESHPPYYRAALAAVHRSGLRNVGIVAIELSPGTMGLLPQADCILFLSVWHHLVREGGLGGATSFLQQTWQHTRRIMFFETGESEEFRGAGFGLPEMLPDTRQWLRSYLTATCAEGAVSYLGAHPSGSGSSATRNLFAIKRSSGESDVHAFGS